MNQDIAKFKQDIDNINIPAQLDFVIEGAIQKGKKPSRWKYIKFTITAACIASFVLSVNAFPSFANYLENVPMVSHVLKAITFNKTVEKILEDDKGLVQAVNNGFAQGIQTTAIDNGIHFTIDNVISDQKRMIITYSVELDAAKYPGVESIWFDNMFVTDARGNMLTQLLEGFPVDMDLQQASFLSRSIMGPGEVPDNEESGKLIGWMEIVKQKDSVEFPREIHMDIDGFRKNFQEDAEKFPGHWHVSFEVPEEIANAKPFVYEGKQFTLEFDRFTLQLQIDYTKIYPTMTEMKIDLLNSSEEIRGIFYTMHLEDETGRIYRHVQEGILTEIGNILPQFESCYFNRPKELFLVIESITIEKENEIQKKVRIY